MPGSGEVFRVAHVLGAQLLHILAHGTPGNILNCAISGLELFVRHAERGKQLAVGCVHAGIGFFDLCLCSSQLRFIRRTFDQHIVVLLVDSVQVLLPSLRFYIVRISIRVLAQSFCAALDGVRFKINIIS